MKTRTPISIYIAATIGLTIMAFEMFASDSGYFSSPFFWALILITIILLLIMNSIGDLVENQNFSKLSEEEKKQYLEEKKVPYYQKLWNSAFKKQSATEEKDILIDHGFDGITELDNSLPKWWIGLFWFGCIFCAVYLVAFSFTDYAHPDAEYTKESKMMLASIAEYEKNAPQVTLKQPNTAQITSQKDRNFSKRIVLHVTETEEKAVLAQTLPTHTGSTLNKKAYLKTLSGCLKTVLLTILPCDLSSKKEPLPEEMQKKLLLTFITLTRKPLL